MASSVLSNNMAEDRLQLLGIDTDREESEIKQSTLVRLIDEMHLEKEREQRLYSAFTFGTKLNKDHKPERHQYF